jgi:hypothetical protein
VQKLICMNGENIGEWIEIEIVNISSQSGKKESL